MILRILAVLVIYLAIAAMFGYGINKQIDINDRTSFDRETGTMVYRETGV